jgi:2'-5' RNA ligase
MASERLFFALWPPVEVRDALIVERRALPGEPGRVHHAEDLHMTLVFVGAVADEARPCIESVGGTVDTAPFWLRISEAGYWSKARIRWCRPTLAPPELLALVGQLEQGLLACGIEPESRPYRPHVTLARKAPPLTARPLSAPVDWIVDDFVLAASGGEQPPRYRVLRRWPLAGSV